MSKKQIFEEKRTPFPAEWFVEFEKGLRVELEDRTSIWSEKWKTFSESMLHSDYSEHFEFKFGLYSEIRSLYFRKFAKVGKRYQIIVNPFNKLNDAIFAKIRGYLKLEDLCVSRAVEKRWVSAKNVRIKITERHDIRNLTEPFLKELKVQHFETFYDLQEKV